MNNLEGKIDKVLYSNSNNGYTIAKLNCTDKGSVTVVGSLNSVSPGETVKVEGVWVDHPKYGEQFKVSSCECIIPTSTDGIEKYLGSGLIKGIGPVTAKSIVERFGSDSLSIIEKSIERLAEVPGIAVKRIVMIKEAWGEQKEIRNVMLFLKTYDVSSGYATKIFKQYGNDSIKIVKENPYKLATDVFGIGFLIADSIAMKMGVDKNSRLRTESGIIYVLTELLKEGHVCFPLNELAIKTQKTLDIDLDIIRALIKALVLDNVLIEELVNEQQIIYLKNYHGYEKYVALKIKSLLSSSKSFETIDAGLAIKRVCSQMSLIFAPQQIEAIKDVINNKITVITGGPGTGKTTIINAIIKIFSKLDINILLAAPTGRAAKRMEEVSGQEAKTIHRLLSYNPRHNEFERNEDNPLNCDILIIDEASMIDTSLMFHLLKAIPTTTTLVLVGDVDQLPAVGAGNTLKDVINSQKVNVVKLNQIFRQALESQIVVNAHKVNNGVIPYIRTDLNQLEDLSFIEKEDSKDSLNCILDLVTKIIPNQYGFDPINDIQVLSPMHKGVAGVANLNMELQKTLNPVGDQIVIGNKTFRVKDKVMQVKNNYSKEVFNGDVGRIQSIDKENQELVIRFGNKEVNYSYNDLSEVILGFASTFHKAQGSEYPAVVLSLLTQHYILLQRNLIYTGITRGKQLVVIVGSRKALAMGVKNDKIRKRYTNLETWLRRKQLLMETVSNSDNSCQRI